MVGERVRVTLRLTAANVKRLKTANGKTGVTASQIVDRLISRHLAAELENGLTVAKAKRKASLRRGLAKANAL